MDVDSTGGEPHGGQPVAHAGTPPERAGAAMVLVHGRGATAESILTLADELGRPDWAYLAPQAAGNQWYPFSFLAPLERNEPGLSSGLALLGRVVAGLGEAGIPPERTVLLGFSQGACLSLEWTARHAGRAARLGGVVALSGGLIGERVRAERYPGWLDGTPVFLGCSDVDPHIPLERVRESAGILRGMGATVTERIYSGMGHTVNRDEIRWVRDLLDGPGGPADAEAKT